MPTLRCANIDTSFPFFQNEEHTINTAFAFIRAKTIDTNFRFLRKVTSNVDTDFRYLQSTVAENLTTPYISREDISLYLDGALLSDCLINSIRISFSVDTQARLEFDLPRKFDKIDYTEANVLSQISDNNIINVYILGTLLWTFAISSIQADFGSSVVHVTAQGEEYSYNKSEIILDMPGLNEQLGIFHLLSANINIYRPVVDVDDVNTTIFQGIKINLGTTIIESVYQSETFLLADLDDISPDQNYTYFWYVEGNNFLTNQYFFPAKYIGTSLAPVSADTYKITGIRWKKQRGVETTTFNSKYQTTSVTAVSIGTGSKVFYPQTHYLSYIPGQAVLLFADNNNYMQGYVTSYNKTLNQLNVSSTSSVGSGTHSNWNIGLVENDPSTFYYVGTAPYKEVSTKNGEYVPAWHWVDKEDGLYQGVNPYYNFKPWARAYADNEYEKLKNINGTIFPQTSSNLDITLDAFIFYGIKLLQRINIGNTSQENIYYDNNGFPLSVKSIVLDTSKMLVSLTADNQWSQAELLEKDALLGTEPIENPGQFFLIDSKYDLAKQTTIS